MPGKQAPHLPQQQQLPIDAGALLDEDEQPLVTKEFNEGSSIRPRKRAVEGRRFKADLDVALSEGVYAAESVPKNEAFQGMVAEKRGKKRGMNESAGFSAQDAEAAMDDIFGGLDEEEGSENEESYEDFVKKQELKAKQRAKQRAARLKEEEAMVAETPDSRLDKAMEMARKQRTKGEHARNQVAICSELLNLRIRLQNPLVSCNRWPNHVWLPLFQDHFTKKQDSETLQDFSEVKQLTREVVDDFLDLHIELLNATIRDWLSTSNSTADGNDVSSPPTKKTRTMSSRAEGSIDALWTDMAGFYESSKNFVDSTLRVWSDRVMGFEGAVKGPSFAQNSSGGAVEQIRTSLQSMDKLVQRTQQNRLRIKPLGSQQPVGQPLTVLPDIYDDNDFYSILLNTVISKGLTAVSSSRGDANRATTMLAGTEAGSEIPLPKNPWVLAKMNAGQNYRIRDKLVNFMTPASQELPAHMNALFSSLFGRIAV